ncbi:MAG: PPC domain-containing protein [Chloroflexi bacterium]|nr:PPC domain-containing protein [Chloroflexota bacterium]
MPDSQLREIQALINSGHKAEARTLLVARLQDQPNNAAAWWLLALAAPNRSLARQSLEQVLRLRPDDARTLAALNQLQAEDAAPSVPLRQLLADVQRLPPEQIEADLPTIELPEIDEIEREIETKEKRKRSALPVSFSPYLLPLLLFALAMILIPLLCSIWMAAIDRSFTAMTTPPRCLVAAETLTPPAGVNDNRRLNATLMPDLQPLGALVFRQDTLGTFTRIDEQHLYTFSGEAWQEITITLWSRTNGFNPLLELYNPAGNQMAYCDDYALDNPGAQLVVYLPFNGTYTVLVRPHSTSPPGNYGLLIH